MTRWIYRMFNKECKIIFNFVRLLLILIKKISWIKINVNWHVGFSSIFENTNRCRADLSRQICIYEDYNGCFDASSFILSKKKFL